ncbi:MAG TPA: type II toxin-antitoxin system death-on-curing family toxin [Phycisphaerae bacterium]|nr:type II toxin-antitoxin system death-on-curing family toxin [Phycisphaerales bacterium]HRX86654.1 type II toxin-antitoxin system death-on-curing family toxin [Phycisphaerae bacterium]
MLPLFLDIERVLRLHLSLIEAYGGEPSVRDVGLLHSALAMPQSTYDGAFLHEDLFEMASAYLFHIVQNHAFIDGNKRTGAASALIILDMNGVEIEADEDGLVDITLRTAMGQAGKAEIAEFFRSRAT